MANLPGEASSTVAGMSTGLSSNSVIIAMEMSAMASQTSHHDPGPKIWSMNGATRPEARMPMPGPA